MSQTTEKQPVGAKLSRRDQLQPVLLLGSIALGLAIGAWLPSVASSLGPGVSVGVFALIFLVMLNVSLGGVAAAFTQRRFLGIAVSINFVVNPLLAWGLGALFLSSEPELRIGLVLFLVTPCIGWYLLFTELAGGNTELGVSLLGINVILQVLLLPAYLALFTGATTTVSIDSVTESIAVYLALPALCAAAVTWLAGQRGFTSDELSEQIHAGTVKTAALACLITCMFASQAEVLFDNPGVFLKLVMPMIAFFTVAFVVARTVGSWMGFRQPDISLLVFTTTSRNSEASLAIAATAFLSPLVGLAVVLGPVIELPLLVVMTQLLRRCNGEPQNRELIHV